MAPTTLEERARRPDPNRPPFSSFLDRDTNRTERVRRRRRIFVWSVAFHVALFAFLALYSFVDVAELFGPSVEVRVFKPSQLTPKEKKELGPTKRELAEPPPEPR